MYKLNMTNKFKKDFRLCEKRDYNISLLYEVLDFLLISGELPTKYKPHLLKGNYIGFWECHLKQIGY